MGYSRREAREIAELIEESNRRIAGDDVKNSRPKMGSEQVMIVLIHGQIIEALALRTGQVYDRNLLQSLAR